MNEEQVQGRREEEKEGDIILLRTHICTYESAQGPPRVISCLLVKTSSAPKRYRHLGHIAR